ncbi:MAG: polyketide cyclase [Cytophagales bacterium CG12_big_fil_rev_8_21_14_0_65_40_12]|nr:MAG: polyketide cyclase [Cytophagales bacterium CG12_big_fil_rev_8_21_14_0_65_40_12]PIW03625.1 MAG: polyketide cyclase [Cytophagales bacterium CG17_big_fil_post_rev_8_21_14_2_50_40_13]
MEDISKRSLKITRVFDAQIGILWKVLTTPEYIKDWWGPDGFTNSIHRMEVVEGGIWEFTMHSPDGTDFENKFTYSEIKPLSKLMLDHLNEPKFTIIITLIDKGNQTEVEWTNVFDSVPSLEEAVRAFKADVGLKQNLERLSLYPEKSLF